MYGLDPLYDIKERISTVESSVKDINENKIPDLKTGISDNVQSIKVVQNNVDTLANRMKSVQDAFSPDPVSWFNNQFTNKFKPSLNGILNPDPVSWFNNQFTNKFKPSLNSILNPDPVSWLNTQLNNKFAPDPSSWFTKQFDNKFTGAFDKNFESTFGKYFLPNLKKEFPGQLNNILSPNPTSWFDTVFGKTFPKWFDTYFSNAFPKALDKFKLPDVTANVKSIGTFITSQNSFDKGVKGLRDTIAGQASGFNTGLVGKDSALGKYTGGITNVQAEITKRLKVLQTMNDKLQALPVKWKSRMDSLKAQITTTQKNLEYELYKKPYSHKTDFAGYGSNEIKAAGIINYLGELCKHMDLIAGLPVNRAQNWGQEFGSTVMNAVQIPVGATDEVVANLKASVENIGNDIKLLMDELNKTIKDTVASTPLGSLPALPASPSDIITKLNIPTDLVPPALPTLKTLP